MLIYLLFSFVVTITSSKVTRGGLLATFPRIVLPDTEAPFCVKFFNLHQNVTIHIEDSEKDFFTPIRQTVSPEHETCFKIKMPKNVNDEQRTIIVSCYTADRAHTFKDKKPYYCKKTATLTFIETDKVIYKPGQKVKIRLLTIDHELSPMNQSFEEIFIRDASHTKVHQWLDVNTKGGLVDLELPLSEEPNLGKWKICAYEKKRQDATSATVTFLVKKYVLPKFELKLHTPKYILLDDKQLNFTVCAKYSYGKGVSGKLVIKTYTRANYEAINYNQTTHTHTQKIKDCEVVALELKKIGVPSMELDDTIDLEAIFTEDDTSVTQTSDALVSISIKRYKIKLIEPVNYYKPGLPVSLLIQITEPDDTAVRNESLSITISEKGIFIFERDQVSDHDGFIRIYLNSTRKVSNGLQIMIDTNEETNYNHSLHERLESSSTEFDLKPWFSREDTYLQIYKVHNEPLKCNQKVQLEIKIRSNRDCVLNGSVYFQVKSRTNIIHTGSYNLETSRVYTSIDHQNKSKLNIKKLEMKNNTHSFSLSIALDEDLSPEIFIIALYVVNLEIISDTAKVRLEKCLKNKVKLSINNDSVRTGDNVIVKVNSVPNSLCALSAIDKSVTFMAHRNNIDIAKIFSSLSEDVENSYREESETGICIEDNYRNKRSETVGEMNFSFKEAGLLLFTDLIIYKTCPEEEFYENDEILDPVDYSVDLKDENELMTNIDGNNLRQLSHRMTEREDTRAIVRGYFPETWLWDIYTLNENGSIELSKTTPDSITEWMLDAYCLSRETSGISIANTIVLNVFQPFFIDMLLPYSAIRGESIPVHVSVFNYMDKCLPINIELNSERVGKCICSNEKVTHTFQMMVVDEFQNKIIARASVTNQTNVCPNSTVVAAVDYSDTEIRSLIIEREGIPKEVVKSAFLSLNKSSTGINETFDVSLPQFLVPGSLEAHVTFIGDPMGAAIDNLGHLVSLPTGCGEQSMIKFAPLISVTNYLKETSQLTAKIADLAREYIYKGYQRQLTYRHPDGSFSTFGNCDALGGNTWLTAFVLRCFASSFQSGLIKIDRNDMNATFNWLLSMQNKDGSFENSGTPLVSKALAGGLVQNHNTGLTAYVLISLFTTITSLSNMSSSYVEAKIELSMEFLRKTNVSSTDTYALALLFYSFKLRNDESLLVEDELGRRSFKQGDMTYWKHETGSAEIEITSYILLAKLYNSNKQNPELLLSIAKWISSKRNSFGGFYSTQDTVVALEALSKFASLFYSKNMDLHLSYSLNSANQRAMHVNDKNRLLLQKVKLPKLNENNTNTFAYTVHGTGSALVQFIVKYNARKDESLKFDLKIEVETAKCPHKASLIIHTRYKGTYNESSMSIVDLRLPTGWIPIEETIKGNLLNHVELKRYEINDDNKISLYFEKLDQAMKTFGFDVVKAYTVGSVKPGTLSVYDYYEPQENNHVSQEFSIDC